jgi:nucleoside-diphosphate-sugar epimerase
MRFSSALITGASGLVGRALTRYLCDQGVDVTVSGRHSSELPKGLRAIRVDAVNPGEIRDALRGNSFDVVFHCAAYGVSPTERDAKMLLRVNVEATAAWLSSAADTGSRAFIYVGSCFEYGSATDGTPIDEDHPLASTELYGASKIAGAVWAQALAKEAGIAFQWVRLFGVYGPEEKPHRLIPYLHERLRRSERVSLTPGLQVRDVLFIDDVAVGLAMTADLALVGKTGPFNLCSGVPITIRDVAAEVARQIGTSMDLLDFGARDYRPSEPMWLVGSAAKLRAASGFAPSVSIHEGIAKTIQILDRESAARPASA